MTQMLKALGAMALWCAASLAWAADAAGCADPAMFPDRIPGYAIAKCNAGPAAHVFRYGTHSESVLGRKSEYVFKAPADSRAEPRYIAANYANALSKIGAQLLQDPAKSTLGDRVVAKVAIDGRDVWVSLHSESPVIGGKWETYTLTIVETDAAVQVVSAQKMLDALNKDGFITLYINFDTGKWDVKPEAKATVDQIVALMKANPQLKLSVEGHTDNVGQAASNKTLSDNRARAVKDAVAASGIAASRLKSAGWGQERPIADNRTEDGRAKNRRVELVKF
jgi:outer membrane protein OmpA-like peptidoglycan-associated protein